MIGPECDEPPPVSPLLNLSKGAVFQDLVALRERVFRQTPKNADEALTLPIGASKEAFRHFTIEDVPVHELSAWRFVLGAGRAEPRSLPGLLSFRGPLLSFADRRSSENWTRPIDPGEPKSLPNPGVPQETSEKPVLSIPLSSWSKANGPEPDFKQMVPR